VRVSITGAAGFIGSHLVDATVREGHAVRALVRYTSRGDLGHLGALAREVREALEIVPLDVRDADAIDRAIDGCDGVFHLAALIGIPYSYYAPESYVAVNVMGTQHLLAAARRHGVRRFVHTSTSEVYGSPVTTPIDEDHRLNAQSPYAATKIAADQLVASYVASFALPAIVVRPFNTYGPRQSNRAVIPSLASQLLDPGLPVVRAGTLETVRDFTFVGDTVRAFLLALACDDELASGTVLNVGTGRGASIREVYELLARSAGIVKPVETDLARTRPPASEVDRLIADATRARRAIGWVPTVTLEDGLAAVVEHLRAHGPLDAARYAL
jgi:nucleoside-diphosphate-sugar epimerase